MKLASIGILFSFVISTLCPTLLGADEQSSPESILTSIPAEAVGSLSIRNLKDVEVRGQALLKELGAPNGWQLSQLFRMGMGFLGVTQGIDESGTFTLALMPWVGEDFNDDTFQNLVIRIPYTEVNEMAKNFTFPEGALVPEKIHKIDNRLNNSMEMYVSVKDGALLMSMNQDAIRAFQKSTSLGAEDDLDSDGRLATTDLLLHFNAHDLLRRKENSKQGLERMMEKLPQFEREEVRQAGHEMVHAAKHFFWSCRIDGGVNLSVQLNFDETLSDQTKRLLATWGSRTQSPDLAGFPTGNLAFAISKTANGLEHPEEVRQFLRWLLMDMSSVPPLKQIAEPFLTPTPNTYQEVFDEIWNSLHESQVGGYFNQNVEEQGLLNLLAILKPNDPKQFYDDLAGLVKFSRGSSYNPRTMKEEKIGPEEIQRLVDQLGADEFRIRKAATLRLKLLGDPALLFLEKSKDSDDREVAARSRKLLEQITKSAQDRQQELIRKGLSPIPLPTFVLYENQRQIDEYRVDVLQAQWNKDSPELRSKLREILGPHGDEILLVHVEEKIVVFLGSDRELLESCVGLLKTPQMGIEQQLTLFRKHRSENQLVEFHFSQQRLRSLLPEHVVNRTPATIPIAPDVTSIGAEIAPTHLLLDVTIPVPELRLVMRTFGMF